MLVQRRFLSLCFASICGGLLLSASCIPEQDVGGPGTGGSTPAGGAGTSGGATGSTGEGGTNNGTAGTSAGTAGTNASTAGTSGLGGTVGSAGTSGAAGAAAGRGGTTGTAGRGGTTGTAGRGGTTGTAGRGGTTGTGGTGTGGAGSGDSFVSGVTVTVHAQTRTILVVTWTQATASEQTWLEFSFPGSSVMTSRAKPGAAGMHRDVVLGVPGSTNVTLRIVNRNAGVDYKTRDYTGMTGAIPTGLPVPMILAYDAAGASPDRYMFGAVEDSPGGCTNGSCYYVATFWVYIMDRQGRIVWYYSDAASGSSTSYQRVARDGEYIVLERARQGNRGVTKMTLDRQYMEAIAVSGLGDAIDVTDDGSVLYDANNELRELNRAGQTRTIWSCRTAFGTSFQCYSNTINWNPADNTVMLSFPEPNTVAQVNRATGALVATYGDRSGSYTFSPTTWSFEFQHGPNITSRGTLLVSTHLSAFPNRSTAGPMQHAFVEFDIDRTNRRLVERWSYTLGTEWPWAKGMVYLLPNGNYLGNYGTGGAIREITPDKRTVFHVKFDVATGNDYFNKMVGNNVLVDDLYALNGGGPQ
jgi:hypothetical protein